MEEIAESPPIPAKLWFPFCILWCIIRDNIHSGGLSALASHAPAQTNLDHNDGGTPIMITRTVAREIAVHYAFELGFSNLTAQELLEQELTQERFGEIAEIDPLYAEFPDEKQCAYIRKLVEGVGEHGYELDEYISKYAIGYTVTADYKGDVTRTSCDTVIYTAVFSSIGNAAAKSGRSNFNWLWLLIPVGAAALGGCGYAGYKGYKHYINKKRGYAA